LLPISAGAEQWLTERKKPTARSAEEKIMSGDRKTRLEKLIAEAILADYLGYFEIAKELRRRATEIEKSINKE